MRINKSFISNIGWQFTLRNKFHRTPRAKSEGGTGSGDLASEASMSPNSVTLALGGMRRRDIL